MIDYFLKNKQFDKAEIQLTNFLKKSPNDLSVSHSIDYAASMAPNVSM